MATPKQWGPLLWNCIHTLSYPFRHTFLTPSQYSLWSSFQHMLPHLLPCPECSDHFQHYQSTHPLPPMKQRIPSFVVYHWWSTCHSQITQQVQQQKKKKKYPYWIEQPFHTLSTWHIYFLCTWLYAYHKKHMSLPQEHAFRLLFQLFYHFDPSIDRVKHLWTPIYMFCKDPETLGQLPTFFETQWPTLWMSYFQNHPNLWNDRCIAYDGYQEWKHKKTWKRMPIPLERWNELVQLNPYPEVYLEHSTWRIRCYLGPEFGKAK